MVLGCALPCRLLFLAELQGGVLVHPVALRRAEAVRAQAGAHAHPYSGQPEGSHGVRVFLPRLDFSCEETDSLHCVHAHKRTVFLSLKKCMIFFF